MALNQSAVNTEVVNGSANSTVAKALSVVTSTTASFLKGISTLKTLTSTSLATLITSYVKPKELIATVSNSVLIIRNFSKIITSSIVSSIVTISKIASYFITLIATSLVTSLVTRSISFIMPVVDVVAATILTAVNRLITLLAYSSTSVTISKNIAKTMDLVVSTVSASIVKFISFVKELSVIVTTIVTVSETIIHYITMTIVSSSLAIIEKFQNKLLTISVDCGIILSRLINVTFTTISTVIQVLLVNTVSFTKYPLERLMYAAQRFRTVSAVKLRKIFY